MPTVDHLVYASRDLDEGVRRIEALTGVRAVAGGPHVGMGTRNALVSFDDTTYLEIIGADPDQPEPVGPRPFGIDDEGPPQLAAYAVRPSPDESIEQVVAAMTAQGFELTDPVPMSRIRPDGVELRWRIAFPATPEAAAEGALPFVIDWGDTASPASTAPVVGTLVSFAVHHPDADVRATVRALDLGVDAADGPVHNVALIDTAGGQVELT